MVNINHLRSDPKLEKGVWVDFGPIKLKIARGKAAEYKKAMNSIAREFRRNKQHGLDIFLENDEAQKKLAPFVARHILVDWKNIEDDNGKVIPYSVKKATEYLLDPTLEDLYVFVLECMNDAALYRQQTKEADLKNL